MLHALRQAKQQFASHKLDPKTAELTAAVDHNVA